MTWSREEQEGRSLAQGGRRYGAAFAIAAVVLAGAAAWAFAALAPSTARRPSVAVAPLETGDTFAVRNVAQIRPDHAAYDAFGEVDRAWRAREIARFERARREESTGRTWRPSAEQLLDDAVFLHSREGRTGAAAALLERWLERRPGDVTRHGSVAVLLAQMGRRDAAIAHRAAAVRARPGDVALRLDLARELAWAGRHGEAVGAWRAVLTMRPHDREARLGLARALASSGVPDEAEPLLDALAREVPQDTSLRHLLRAVRAGLAPSSERTARWAREDPTHVPYHIAYARALDREGAPAAEAWDRVLRDSVTIALLSEAAGSAAASRDSVRNASLVGRAVALAPADRALRTRWAEALAWSGDQAAAIREYGTLLDERDDAALRLARGQLRVWRGDEGAGAVDLARSVQLSPSYEAYALLGDLHRWRGDHAAARSMYEQALALRPADPTMLRAIADARAAQLAAERAARGGMLATRAFDAAHPGWAVQYRFAEDNSGYYHAALGVARGFAAGRSTVVGLSAEQRRIAQRFARARTRWLTGYAIGLSASHDLGMFRLAGTAGLARHALVRDVPYGSVAASVRRRATSLTLEASRTTAYEQLWAMGTLVNWEAVAAFRPRPLTARSVTVRGAMPVGRAGVDVTVEQMRLGDGNARLAGSVGVRAPVGSGVSVLYAGGAMAYADASGSYWAPRRYEAHAAGLEYARAIAPGVRVAARVLPGVVRTDDRLRTVRGEPVNASAWSAQFGAGGDLVVERARWSAAMSAGFGQGARGAAGQQGYRALSGGITVRARW